MTDAHTTTSGVASPANSLVAVAALGSLIWVVGEFAIRRGLTPPLADATGIPGFGFGATIALTGLLLAPVVAYAGTQVGISPRDWEVSPSLRSVGWGVAAFVACQAFLMIAAVVYTKLVGAPSDMGVGAAFAELSTLGLATILVANGIVAPIAEEIAWRGVVQTALVDAYGVTVGIAVTAAVFVAKHVVVDLGATPLRLLSLAVLAVAWGVLRHRYGTSSSIVAHVLANTSATALVILA
jgi:membrane protease YdiL (CAAX protease family)